LVGFFQERVLRILSVQLSLRALALALSRADLGARYSLWDQFATPALRYYHDSCFKKMI